MIPVATDLLKPIVDDYDKVTKELSSKWIERKRVSETLKRYNISGNFFKKYFGRKIYEYFIGVIREEKEAGNCPYIHIFLRFCSDKNIQLHEIYMICSELKNVVVHHYIQNIYHAGNTDAYWQIVDLWDANFSGVIEEFITSDYTVTETIEETGTEATILSSERLADIRFNDHQHYDSNYLFEMLSVDTVDKIEQFVENLDEMLLTLYELEEALPEESLQLMKKIVVVINDFHELVDTFVVFPVVVRTFNNLSKFLSQIKRDAYQKQDRKEVLVAHLIGLFKDLEQWINIVFIQKAAKDVHYLDASFANNVAEIESIFNEKTIVTQDDDSLEFF